MLMQHGSGVKDTRKANQAVGNNPMCLVCYSSSEVDCAVERGHGGLRLCESRGSAQAGDFFLRSFIGGAGGNSGGLRWARCRGLV